MTIQSVESIKSEGGIERFIQAYNPDAYLDVETERGANNQHLHEMLMQRAVELLGDEAVEFLNKREINLIPFMGSTDAFGKLTGMEGYGFNYLGRDVVIQPDETQSGVKGVSVSFYLDKRNTSPEFDKDRFKETGDTLRKDTVGFLRFLGEFVETVDNNLIIDPSDDRRKELYTEFFKKHGPKNDHVVFVAERPVRKQDTPTPSQSGIRTLAPEQAC